MGHAERGDGERRKARLTDEEMEAIASVAAEIVIEGIYVEIGKVTIRALLFVAGSAGVALLAWLGIVQKIGG